MNDRDIESMAGDADAVSRLDLLLDALAAGERPDSGDPLIGLLADARAELDAATAVPVAPPDINALLDAGSAAAAGATVTPIASGRHRRHRRGGILAGLTGRAAAAGGVSVTGMVIAGGVAAAIAVGGLGVAVYQGAIPGIPAHDEVTDGRQNTPAPETSTGGPTSPRSVTPGSSNSTSPSADAAPTGAESTTVTELTETGVGTPTDAADPTTEPPEDADGTGASGDPSGTDTPGEGVDPTGQEPASPTPTSGKVDVDDGATGQEGSPAGPVTGEVRGS
ncbi:hypothetical protein [uncultured Corynebacterium sp.]|uniref:hypothetical protein n=1 Tax=uncultured Corynebacterium sp. TaxID=159447 RepID=UPI0025CD20FD|nr:hypothetical protein [uncultured Corynebacterium sp.]